MFDVPVLEVTVSSAPSLISDIRQTNRKSLHTFWSALLGNAPVLPKIDGELSTADVNTVQAGEALSKALLPDESFELLQPLNLADITASLETVFENSLDNQPAQLESDNQLSASNASSPIPEVLSQVETRHQSPVTDAQIVPAIAPTEKSAPVVPRHKLEKCVDVPYAALSEGTTTFKVMLRGQLVGELSALKGSEQVSRSLQDLLSNESINPDDIAPVLDGEQPLIRIGSEITLKISHRDTNNATIAADKQPTLSQEWAAIVWSDELRKEMGAPPLDAGNVQIMLKSLQRSDPTLSGIASWYGPYFHGRQTANGETFNQNTLTAAHKTLPFDTILQVRNLDNNQTVVVRINDRGPYIGQRSLDLSKAAAQCLDSETVGVISYEAAILEQPTSGSPAN